MEPHHHDEIHKYYRMGPESYCPYHDRLIPFCYNEKHWAYECDEPTSVPDFPSLHHPYALNARGGRFTPCLMLNEQSASDLFDPKRIPSVALSVGGGDYHA